MKINIEIKIPSTPNFIMVNDNPMPIADFTTKELKKIGKDWTNSLIEKADRNRDLQPNPKQ